MKPEQSRPGYRRLKTTTALNPASRKANIASIAAVCLKAAGLFRKAICLLATRSKVVIALSQNPDFSS